MADKLPSFQHGLGNHPPWEACCITHDRAYHAAGQRQADINESFKQRRAADLALEKCVIETGLQQKQQLLDDYGLSAQDVKLLYSAIAALMYRAVRIGGMPCTGLPWRWGYGWPKCE